MISSRNSSGYNGQPSAKHLPDFRTGILLNLSIVGSKSAKRVQWRNCRAHVFLPPEQRLMNFSGTYKTILMPVGIVENDDQVIPDCASFVSECTGNNRPNRKDGNE